MTFIVSLVALLIERFFDWSHLRNWNWFGTYARKLLARVPAMTSYLALAAVIVPLLLVVVLLQFVLQGWLYGLPGLLFQILLLLYCFGPQNLWADAFGTITCLSQGDMGFATDKLKASFGLTGTGDVAKSHQLLMNGIFIQANCRVFAVVFWYAVLGPVGAVFYRAVVLCTDEAALTQSARTVEDVLNWLPTKLMTLLFALGGNFAQVLHCWRKKVNLSLSGNNQFLVDCGSAALGKEEQDNFPVDGSVERAAVSLLDRAFVIALVLILIESLLA
jgi:membrane protein required for beta-lactamase induction